MNNKLLNENINPSIEYNSTNETYHPNKKSEENSPNNMSRNIQILNQNSSKNKESVSTLLQEAYNLRKKNMYKESLVIYNNAVQLYPDNYKI